METSKKMRRKDNITAQAKCEAVLSIWAQLRKPADVCQELDVPWGVVNQWQERAMRAMLESLEPRQIPRGETPKLPLRLQKMFDRHVEGHQQRLILPKMEARLNKIQQDKNTKKTPNEG